MGFRQKANQLLDHVDEKLCKLGLARAATWEAALSKDDPKLYAGKLSRNLDQYVQYFGLTPFLKSRRNICHDIRSPFPIPSDSISRLQAEDVFEHIPLETVPSVIEEVHRVLKPGGLFRFSVPDYNCDILRDRSEMDSAGKVVFDPGGGGYLKDGIVGGGGHLWFPTVDQIVQLFDKSPFLPQGKVHYLHFTNEDGSFTLDDIDHSLGPVKRTPDFDSRVQRRRRPLSIVVDAIKCTSM